MDKIVQNTSASAEQSASASEQMAAQAEELKGIVRSLVRIVEGVDVHNIYDADQFEDSNNTDTPGARYQLMSGE
jgi:transcriptional regulator of NAD metabolism